MSTLPLVLYVLIERARNGKVGKNAYTGRCFNSGIEKTP